jgi:hypothetical protein
MKQALAKSLAEGHNIITDEIILVPHHHQHRSVVVHPMNFKHQILIY